MTIGEVSRRTGLAASAIRYYEDEKLIPPPARRGGRRVFDETIIERLAVIAIAQQAGFSIAEIRQLLGAFRGERWQKLAERKRAEVRATAAHLRVMDALLGALIECGCFDVEACGRAIRRQTRRRSS